MDWDAVIGFAVLAGAAVVVIASVAVTATRYRRLEPGDRKGIAPKVGAIVDVGRNIFEYGLGSAFLVLLAVAVIAIPVGVIVGTDEDREPKQAKQSSNGGPCDPSYPDRCLNPNVSDYDCAGNSGNGPRYVRGPLRVTGADPFGLDSGGTVGVGCE